MASATAGVLQPEFHYGSSVPAHVGMDMTMVLEMAAKKLLNPKGKKK
jgi:hypothetical protein